MRKLLLGLGFLGIRVARLWRLSGHEVHVVTRQKKRISQITAEGFRPIVADITDPKSLHSLPEAETVLFAVGYDRSAGKSMQQVQVDGLTNVLNALPDSTGRLIYISSTGVYSQSGGESVDESSACVPLREGGKACLEAEQCLAAHRLGARGIVLRLAGLYGPGRIPLSKDILSGRLLAVPQLGYLNLIHVDDAAEVILAAERDAVPPRLYLVADGHPVKRSEYYRYLAQLLGAAEPQFEALPIDSPALQRAASSKRINNQRMLSELDIKLCMPSYREGLAAIVAEQKKSESD